MADEIVPQDDLPGELVPQSDLPEQEPTYDPRSQVPRALGAGAGAVAGAVVPPLVQAGVNRVEQARAGKIPTPTEATPGRTPFKPRGVSVEDSLENWRNYNEAQLEAAKKVRQESKLHKKYPGFTRAGTVPEIPPLPENATTAQKILYKLAPNAVSDIGHFLQGVSEYKLPFIGKIGPLAGHLLGGAGAFSQGVDAYNRGEQGDITGKTISGLGSVGTAASILPFPPPIRALGFGVGLSAEAINAYRDAMREGRIEHGAPETYENADPMGGQYAQGGLAHLANGGQPYSIAPYGFRHIESVEDVSMPKGKGYFGLLPNQAGGVSTEISADSNGMQYPLLNPMMNRQEIDSLLANQQPTEDMYRKAEQFARYRKSQGKSPFISPIGELRWPLPKK